MSYDSWKLATPPEYEQGEPPEREDEPEELVCSECRTVTRVEFSNGGRCEDCDAPVEEPSEEPLLDRLKRAQARAYKRWAALPESDKRGRLNASLDCHQARLWAEQVAKIEDGLKELEARS